MAIEVALNGHDAGDKEAAAAAAFMLMLSEYLIK